MMTMSGTISDTNVLAACAVWQMQWVSSDGKCSRTLLDPGRGDKGSVLPVFLSTRVLLGTLKTAL